MLIKDVLVEILDGKPDRNGLAVDPTLVKIPHGEIVPILLAGNQNTQPIGFATLVKSYPVPIAAGETGAVVYAAELKLGGGAEWRESILGFAPCLSIAKFIFSAGQPAKEMTEYHVTHLLLCRENADPRIRSLREQVTTANEDANRCRRKFDNAGVFGLPPAFPTFSEIEDHVIAKRAGSVAPMIDSARPGADQGVTVDVRMPASPMTGFLGKVMERYGDRLRERAAQIVKDEVAAIGKTHRLTEPSRVRIRLGAERTPAFIELNGERIPKLRGFVLRNHINEDGGLRTVLRIEKVAEPVRVNAEKNGPELEFIEGDARNVEAIEGMLVGEAEWDEFVAWKRSRG
jgi:hypothetical protein